MEFAKLVSEKKDPRAEVKVHLITANNENYIENAQESFQQMAYSLESIGILFSYEFDDNIHDRSINLNNSWKVILGRGLDIWQRTSGWFDINEYVQEKQICKAYEVTVVKR
jgi:ATP-dependent Lon protease